MKQPKNNAYVEVKKDSAGYWLVVNGVAVFTGARRLPGELLEELTQHGPVMLTREG